MSTLHCLPSNHKLQFGKSSSSFAEKSYMRIMRRQLTTRVRCCSTEDFETTRRIAMLSGAGYDFCLAKIAGRVYRETSVVSLIPYEVGAVSTSKRALRGQKIPESEYVTLPSGLKYYDLKVGSGPEAVKGSRVAIHYVARWKGVTFMTSRQGLGITGGTPYGFEVGSSERGTVLRGLDLGVEGMKVGGQRLLTVPPELGYGDKGIQEIPPNATLEFDVELLSVKQLPYG